MPDSYESGIKVRKVSGTRIKGLKVSRSGLQISSCKTFDDCFTLEMELGTKNTNLS